MEKKSKVRLSDIAQKLGISTVTVSKALADKDGVGDDLRQKIKVLAEEMGYRAKKTSEADSEVGMTGNIGILIPSQFFSPSSSFYWHLFNHLSTELLRKNYYSIMELLSKDDEKKHVLPRMLQDKKVDGLIILGQTSNEYLDFISSHYENFILLDFYTNKTDLDCVADDNFYCSYILTSYVISQGHRKLRFVGKFDSTTSIRDRYMGYAKALLENWLDVDYKRIIDDRDENGNYVEINLPKDDMPTCFVCNCDETAAKLIEKLSDEGYSVPGDISVTGFDDFLVNNSQVSLTTVSISPEVTASVAADLIIKKITGQPYIKGRHLVSGTLVLRDSVKKI